MKKEIRNLTALLCASSMLLAGASPAMAYQGSVPGVYASSVNEDNVKIRIGDEPKVFPYKIIGSHTKLESSNEDVVNWFPENDSYYFYGVSAGTADISLYTRFQDWDDWTLYTVVHVTVSDAASSVGSGLGTGGSSQGNSPSSSHTHSWKTSEVEPANCTESGTEYQVCVLCGETTEVEIPASGHDY